MSIDWATLGALVGALGGGGWLGNVLLETIRNRGKRSEVQADIGLRIETHRDALTFQLLEAARLELKGLRDEVNRLRPLETHLLFFDQALDYIELLLFARTEKDRADAEQRATLFLSKMRGRHPEQG